LYPGYGDRISFSNPFLIHTAMKRTDSALIAIVVPVLFFLSCTGKEEPENQVSMKISENWEFRQAGDTTWLPAKVPGTVHTDLLANGKIGDPFYRLNEHDLQWIDKTDWEYRTVFTAPELLAEKERVEICFGGLDTYADVYLNDVPVLKADNMFRQWKADIREYLKPGKNTLRVYFHSPVKIGLDKLEALDYTLPDPPNDLSEIGGLGDKKVSIFTRKAPYHFGWDWGPRLVTSGIWKDVVIRGWDMATIEHVFVQQVEVSEEKADLKIHLEVASTGNRTMVLEGLANGKNVMHTTVSLQPGMNEISQPLTIEDPDLWWPNGLGEQPLYYFNFTLSAGASVIAKAEARTGLRDIQVVREKDSVGECFLFRINGHPVFMKGANYIPQDVFLPRVTPGQYEHIIQSAADTHMNMLRVWGGGIYEKDIFYELCDEKGILVWQDFMFACAMYPGNEAFLESVRQEAIDNVKRLRNHPSIALWCGNNEILSAWNFWGWKPRVTMEQGKEIADTIWKSYEDKFHKLLPGVVETYDPGRFYWSSSPSAGQGIPENYVAGDVHYWGVWWGKEPFETYRTTKCRFMSEYGFQSFPELNTIRKFAEERDWDIYSEVMKSHQRSSIGNETIEYYMLQDYRRPKDFPMFLYVGQVVQAEGTRIAMEGHRTNMPYCMGSLYWQIDDCWPVASWSTIDYYGNWKAQQYFARKAFRDIIVSPILENGMVTVYIVSDRPGETPAMLHLTLMDFSGTTLDKRSMQVTIPANSSRVYFSGPVEQVTGNAGEPNRILLYCGLEIDGEPYTDNILYFARVKDLDLPVPGLEWELTGTAEGLKLKIGTDQLAKNVCLSVTGKEVFFGDNYFDLLPGQETEISLQPGEGVTAGEIRENLQVISLVDSYMQ
jgi:beta-mannosidase